MASIVTYSGGLRRIDFVPGKDQRRRSVRLGAVSMKTAEAWQAKVEALLSDRLRNRPHDAELAEWLGGLDEMMLSRLRNAGLADGVGLAQTTLEAFLTRYFGNMTAKESTRTFYGHTRRNLLDHFGAATPLRNIKTAEADGWRAWLTGQGLSAATIARRIIAARTFWRAAVRWRLAAENPFAGIKAGHQSNDDRKRFIPAEAIDRAIAAAPDAEWRTIIALSRYGGLRCPSEHFALRWADINWERGTIRVTVPKLAHIERCAHRTVPLFPELRKHLLDLFTEAEAGSEYVITRYRDPSQNLRTQFEKIIARAGLSPWPRLFHNLRASRETELMREYDLATVCKWIGNSPEIAARHYATSVDLDADFRKAAGLDGKAQQNAQQSAAVGDKSEVTGFPTNAKKPSKSPQNAVGATADNCCENASMGVTGLEPVTPSL